MPNAIKKRLLKYPLLIGALTGVCISLCIFVPPCIASSDWRIWSGTIGRVQPRTKGADGYGNHGKYGSDSVENLNKTDRENANWDGAPGFFLGAENLSRKSWIPGVNLDLGLYTKMVIVDTEYNETQENWMSVTGSGGVRVVGGWLPWLKVFGGIGGGSGYVAERAVFLSEYDYGVEVGSFRFSKGVQILDGGRVLDHNSNISIGFDIGTRDNTKEIYTPLFYGFTARLVKHPGREVKTIHQNGFNLGYNILTKENRAVFLEGEITWAAVESKIERPLNETIPHNYRTMDEFFSGLYLGVDMKMNTIIDHLRLSIGGETYCENDRRVNPGNETGCFLGGKAKGGVGVSVNEKTSVMFSLVGGLDVFGPNYGIEFSLFSLK